MIQIKNKSFFNSIFSYVKEMFLIFSRYNAKESFYLPQRIIIPILISLFTLVYCVFQVTSYTFNIIGAVIVLQNAVSNNIFGFINQCAYSFWEKFTYSLSNEDLESYYETIHKLILILNDLQISIKLGLIVSNVIICFIFGCSLINLLLRFKKIVLQSRHKVKVMQTYQKYDISSSSDLTGIMMGSTVISYLIVATPLTLTFGMIFNKYFWIILWEYKIVLFIMFLPSIIQYFIDLLMNFLIYEDNLTIKLPFILQLYDIYCLIASIFQGIAASFGRIFLGLFGFFIGLIRYDKEIIPNWLEIPFVSDNVAESFQSAITMHIIYNNSIFCAAFSYLFDLEKNKFKKSIKKLWLCFVLNKFQDLSKTRKFKVPLKRVI